MKQIKVVIGNNPELNARVQEHATLIGYSWEIQFNKPVFTDSQQLYLNSRGFIYRDVANKKQRKEFWEVEAQEFMKMKRADVDYLYTLEM